MVQKGTTKQQHLYASPEVIDAVATIYRYDYLYFIECLPTKHEFIFSEVIYGVVSNIRDTPVRSVATCGSSSNGVL